MGAECIGKSHQHPSQARHRTISSPTSDTQGCPQSLWASTLHRQIAAVLSTRLACSYPLDAEPPRTQEWCVHHQFHYEQESQGPQSSSSLSRPPPTQTAGEEWGLCTILDRDLWERKGHSTFLFDSQSFVAKCNKTKQMPKEVPASMPERILQLNFQELKEDDICITSSRQHSVSSEKDLFSLLRLVGQEELAVKSINTPFLSGFLCFSDKSKETKGHFLFPLLGLRARPKTFSLLLFTRKMQSKNQILKLNKNTTQNIPLTYCQLQHLTKVGKIEALDPGYLSWLEDPSSSQLARVFFALQLLKCYIDSMEKRCFQNGFSPFQRKELVHKKISSIEGFLSIKRTAWKPLLFLARCFLSGPNFPRTDYLLKELVQAVASRPDLVVDGIFRQFGLEVNQKLHPFRNSPFYFPAKQSQEPLHLIRKHVLPQNYAINSAMMQKLKNLCSQGCSLSVESIDQELKEDVVGHSTQNFASVSMFVFLRDFQLRVLLLRFIVGFSKGNFAPTLWTAINDSFGLIERIAIETAFVFLVVAAEVEHLRTGIQFQESKKSYLRALEVGLKLFGDPRACRQGEKPCDSVWFFYLLLNYAQRFKGAEDKLEFNFLTNLTECLYEDLKNQSSFSQQLQQGKGLDSWDVLLKNIPLRSFSGVFLRRSDIWDLEREVSCSNFSESGSSVTKRLFKSFYRVNEWEFGLGKEMMKGVLQWGNSKVSSPQPIPALKNLEVLALGTSNYHVALLTEQGLFGWGQNHSGQLGKQNLLKIYEPLVQIVPLKVRRKEDSFQICCGNEHTALLLNGKLMVWGNSQSGILGGSEHQFQSVVSGGLHMLGLREGRVFSWGRGEGGQLGHPVQELKQSQREQTIFFFIDSPKQVKGIGPAVAKLACGDAHSMVLTREGRAWVFGFCYQGQLGLGITGESQKFQIFEPTELVLQQGPISDIWAGPTYSFFKTQSGQVFSCGYNDCLQLGIDRVLKILQKKKFLHRAADQSRRKMGEEQFSKPRRLDIFRKETGLKLVNLSCGQNHCIAEARFEANSEQLLIGWGLNKHFQLDFRIAEVSAPRTLDVLHSVPIRRICCGSSFSLALVGDLPMTRAEVAEQCQSLSSHQ